MCVVPDDASSEPTPSCENTTSLNHFCQGASDVPDHTIVTLLSGTHHLNTTCQFKNVENITVRGETGSNVTVQCSPEKESGFQYLNVSKLLMTSIELRGCGAAWKLLPPKIYKVFDKRYRASFSAGLMVINGTDHTLNKVTAYYSNIIMTLYDAAGTVTMSSIQVAGNNDTLMISSFFFMMLMLQETAD